MERVVRRAGRVLGGLEPLDVGFSQGAGIQLASNVDQAAIVEATEVQDDEQQRRQA